MNDPSAAGGPRGIRISDADRERAAQRLHTALAEGRITVSELEERLSAGYAARYESELDPPLADLPGAPVAPTTPAGLTIPTDKPLVLKSGMGTIKRNGMWTVPARLRVQSAMGTAVLDFCDTALTHLVPSMPLAGVPHFRVHGRAGMGSVTVRRRYHIAGYSF